MNSSPLYTKSAAARILGIGDAAIKSVQEWASVVFVIAKGIGARFMSKKSFLNDVANSRREAAKGLGVQQLALTKFRVTNPARGTSYIVTTEANSVPCECRDYSELIAKYGRAACKHSFSVLSHLGYNSLAEYLSTRTTVVGRPAPTTFSYGKMRGIAIS